MLSQQAPAPEVDVVKNELSAAVMAGKLAADRLSAAIRQRYTVRNHGSRSLGLTWMQEHPELLRFIPNLADLLVAHLDVDGFADSLLMSRNIMEVIPDFDRTWLYVQTFARSLARDRTWLSDAMQLGVPQESIAKAILKRLGDCTIEPTKSVRNFMQHEFMRSGCGPIATTYADDGSPSDTLNYPNTPTYWSVLSDKQLENVVRSIAHKAPHLFFESLATSGNDISMRRKLRVRLSDEIVDSLFKEAASQLTSLARVSLDELALLPSHIQLKVAHRTGGSVELIVRLALLTDGPDARSLLAEFTELFRGEGSVETFCSLWPLLVASRDKKLVWLIRGKLLLWAMAQGYAYGQVTANVPRSGKIGHDTNSARVVHWSGERLISYVQRRSQRNYAAKVGDWVFFRPSEAERLNSRASSVSYIFAHTSAKDA